LTAIDTFRFGSAGEFTLRPALLHYKTLAAEWTALDPDHAGRVPADFWLTQDHGVDSYLLQDDKGPLFFFRVDSTSTSRGLVAALHIQFRPSEGPEDDERTRNGIYQGLTWLEPMLRAAGVRAVSFDSTNEPLVRYSVKRLGFEQRGSRLIKHIG
jgi:hypothetical protein